MMRNNVERPASRRPSTRCCGRPYTSRPPSTTSPRRAIRPGVADVARLTPLGHPIINLDGRYRTTNRPPATGLRPLRIN